MESSHKTASGSDLSISFLQGTSAISKRDHSASPPTFENHCTLEYSAETPLNPLCPANGAVAPPVARWSGALARWSSSERALAFKELELKFFFPPPTTSRRLLIFFSSNQHPICSHLGASRFFLFLFLPPPLIQNSILLSLDLSMLKWNMRSSPERVHQEFKVSASIFHYTVLS